MARQNWDRTAINPRVGELFADEDPEELARLEEMSVRAAIKLSLETEEEKKKRDQPTDLPQRKFKAEEIEEDEKKRAMELYGPPTPPRRKRQIDAMSTSKGPSANTAPTAGGANKPTSRKGAAKKPQEAAAVDGVFIPKTVVDKLPSNVRSAVADAVIYHRQLVSAEAARDIVAVMMGYNGNNNNSGGNLARPESSPAPRGSGPVPGPTGQGFDGAAAARFPDHGERMDIIRAALSDPNSSLSLAMPGNQRAPHPQKKTRRD